MINSPFQGFPFPRYGVGRILGFRSCSGALRLLCLQLFHLLFLVQHEVTVAWSVVHIKPSSLAIDPSDIYSSEHSNLMTCKHDHVTYIADLSKNGAQLTAFSDDKKLSHWTVANSKESIILPGGWKLLPSPLNLDWTLLDANESIRYRLRLTKSHILDITSVSTICRETFASIGITQDISSPVNPLSKPRSVPLPKIQKGSILYSIRFRDTSVPFITSFSIACLYIMGIFKPQSRDPSGGNAQSRANSKEVSKELCTVLNYIELNPHLGHSRLRSLASGMLQKAQDSSDALARGAGSSSTGFISRSPSQISRVDPDLLFVEPRPQSPRGRFGQRRSSSASRFVPVNLPLGHSFTGNSGMDRYKYGGSQEREQRSEHEGDVSPKTADNNADDSSQYYMRSMNSGYPSSLIECMQLDSGCLPASDSALGANTNVVLSLGEVGRRRRSLLRVDGPFQSVPEEALASPKSHKDESHSPRSNHESPSLMSKCFGICFGVESAKPASP